ncbi:cysteinyl-tRNA synthetase [Nitrobacter winogradskyi]|uniref:Cysteinyl-tRNA synthetase n=1 Tax=Nitrobacter winogradskyi TaxID=913 RepID=A0ACC6AG90_NITWI|nr:cysteinyl-tRNA synthetase [Nitrobacter winogradskyi]
MLFRLLRHLYGDDHVTYVRNITDVDDKINDRAARDFPDLPLNEAIRKVTEKTAAQFQADVAALGCLPPTHQPRATEFVLPRADGKTDMVTFISQLIARGHAYEAGGEVLFDVRSMPDYGALSGRRLEEQKAGARVAVDAHKRNPADFVLWKLSSENEPGWDSPWGRGRPGWHIECSAMSTAYLGEVFDIHGGGLDLIFPHHENEIAQSRCAHGSHAMANYWMHNGFLQVEGEKMSKSLGNFVTINELLDKWRGYAWSGETLRFSMLQTHYRQPIDWTAERLTESFRILDGWYRDVEHVPPSNPVPDEVLEPLCDDLNGAKLFAALHTFRKQERLDCLRSGLLFLGFSCDRNSPLRIPKGVQINAPTVLMNLAVPAPSIVAVPLSEVEIRKRVVARAEARARKDFKESDRIRDELAAMGVVLKDGKDVDGTPVTTWEIAR